MSNAKFNALFSVLIFLHLSVALQLALLTIPSWNALLLWLWNYTLFGLLSLIHPFQWSSAYQEVVCFLGFYFWSWHLLHSFLRQSHPHSVSNYRFLLCIMIITSMPLPLTISNFPLEFSIINIFTQCSLTHYVLNLLFISNPSSYSPKVNFSYILHGSMPHPL